MSAVLLLTTVMCLSVLSVVVLKRVPLRLDKTLSQHINQTAYTIFIGRVFLAIAGLALICWAILIKTPSAAIELIALAIGACFIIMGQFPYGASRRNDIVHDIAAWGSMVLMLALETFLFGIVGLFLSLPQIIVGLAIISQVLLIVTYILVKPAKRTLMLIGQFIYFFTFMLSLAVIEVVYA